jgi:hypothetical protein
MTQEKETKTVVNYNWLEFLILLIFIAGSVFFGIKTARLTEKDTKHIAKQAVLEAQKDSLMKQNKLFVERITMLEADVQLANQTTEKAEVNALQFKRKYLDLKNATPPSPCDTSPALINCDKQLLVYENFITILKSNVLSYSRLSDTLRLQNTILTDAMSTCDLLVADQKQELTTLRKQAKRGKTLNWTLGGFFAGDIVILLVK